MHVKNALLHHSNSMKFLIVFIVAGFFPALNSLACIDHDSALAIKLVDFDILSFSSQLKQLRFTQNEPECRVRLLISIVTQKLSVVFTKQMNSINLQAEIIMFLNIIQSKNEEDIEFLSALQYACSDYDRCDQQFILDYVEFLVTLKYTEYLQNASPLLINKKKPLEHCTGGENANRLCNPGDKCVAEWSLTSNMARIRCQESSIVAFQAVTYINITSLKRTQENLLMCNYNECNGIGIMRQFDTHLKNYYNLTLNTMFFDKNKSVEQIQTSTANVASSYSENLQRSSMEKQLSSSSKVSIIMNITKHVSASTTQSSVTTNNPTTTPSSTTPVSKNSWSLWHTENTTIFIAFATFIIFLANYDFRLH
ncbi:unnamed protein product [Adineta ricciae]|uniref:Uncharacterized protein n=1 Tax=Adineta ricciae TaxID=249248 RepID=A0A815W138_ADIRI|nr:unnamed protein product [Adineta ricciae]CAF1634383.1 unnamed protein product [Adineta ricciae]